MVSLRTLRSWRTIWLIAVIDASAAAAPLERGEELHNQYCTVCHASMTGGDGGALYTREQRRVNALLALKAQVRRCASGQGLRWSEADVDLLTNYLNMRYYRFDQ